jgi:hypothetical protein
MVNSVRVGIARVVGKHVEKVAPANFFAPGQGRLQIGITGVYDGQI